MLYFVKYGAQWQATKSALLIRYVDLIGSSPKRKWDIVTPPDFLES